MSENKIILRYPIFNVLVIFCCIVTVILLAFDNNSLYSI